MAPEISCARQFAPLPCACASASPTVARLSPHSNPIPTIAAQNRAGNLLATCGSNRASASPLANGASDPFAWRTPTRNARAWCASSSPTPACQSEFGIEPGARRAETTMARLRSIAPNLGRQLLGGANCWRGIFWAFRGVLEKFRNTCENVAPSLPRSREDLSKILRRSFKDLAKIFRRSREDLPKVWRRSFAKIFRKDLS